MATRRRRRARRSSVALRWLAVGVLGLIAFFYYRPLNSYFSMRSALAQRGAEVDALRVQHRTLERRLAATMSDTALQQEARRLGLVKPGERLFIVKGIGAWLRRHNRHAPTMRGDG